MSTLTAGLIGRTEIARSTWAFRLAVPGPFDYRPGQTVDVTLPEPLHRDAAGNRRTFSIASAPGQGAPMVATRVRDSAFKRSLVEGPLDMPIEVEGPFGSFVLPSKPTPVVLLAGGIGVTPFRAMVEDAVVRGDRRPITLFHSSRTPADAPFLAELSHWSESHRTFDYRPTMTGVEAADMAWSGERRMMGPELLAEALPADRNAPLYYIAGPDGFVKGMAKALAEIGVDEDRVRMEEFPGY